MHHRQPVSCQLSVTSTATPRAQGLDLTGSSPAWTSYRCTFWSRPLESWSTVLRSIDPGIGPRVWRGQSHTLVSFAIWPLGSGEKTRTQSLESRIWLTSCVTCSCCYTTRRSIPKATIDRTGTLINQKRGSSSSAPVRIRPRNQLHELGQKREIAQIATIVAALKTPANRILHIYG